MIDILKAHISQDWWHDLLQIWSALILTITASYTFIYNYKLGNYILNYTQQSLHHLQTLLCTSSADIISTSPGPTGLASPSVDTS